MIIPTFARLIRGLRWAILAMIIAVALAGCPSTSGGAGGNTNQPAQISTPNGAVTNENPLNVPDGCGPSCTATANP